MSPIFPQESDRVNGARVAWVFGGSLLVGFVGVGVAALMLRAHPAPPVVSRPAPAQLGIVEQSLVESSERGVALRRRHREELQRCGPVAGEPGIATIPIDRAMDILEEHRR